MEILPYDRLLSGIEAECPNCKKTHYYRIDHLGEEEYSLINCLSCGKQFAVKIKIKVEADIRVVKLP